MNIMRHLIILSAFVAATFASFAQSPTNSAPKAIVGTWQWVRVDRQVIPYPFFMRFYSDGTSASWPAPEGFSTTNGISHGGYHFERGYLVIETSVDKSGPKAKVEISGDELTMVSCGETNRLVYHRIIPDLEPGKFLPGHPSHGPPDL